MHYRSKYDEYLKYPICYESAWHHSMISDDGRNKWKDLVDKSMIAGGSELDRSYWKENKLTYPVAIAADTLPLRLSFLIETSEYFWSWCSEGEYETELSRGKLETELSIGRD